jgi:transcriptional regulator with XRE-family HTH domain
VQWTPEKIVELRDERGWTQQQLADEINVSRRVIQMWEAGHPISKSNRRALDRLAAAMDREIVLSPSELARRLPLVPSSALLAEVARRFALIPADTEPAPTDLPAGTWRVPTSDSPSGRAETDNPDTRDESGTN